MEQSVFANETLFLECKELFVLVPVRFIINLTCHPSSGNAIVNVTIIVVFDG